MKRFLNVIDCTQQLQVRENLVGFRKAFGAVEVIKDQIQYRSQSLLNLARSYCNLEHSHLIDCMRQIRPGALCAGVYKWAQSDCNDKRANSIAVSGADLLSVYVL